MKTLTDIFYDLYNDGWIYDEDENGHNMSYEEYIEISNYMQKKINEQIQGLDFPEAIEMWKELVEYGGDDDAKMFSCLSEEEIYLDAVWEDYDEETDDWILKCNHPEDLPQVLQASYFDWLEYHPEIAA